jgi:tetratricopeptide (TPR) repeat protein
VWYIYGSDQAFLMATPEPLSIEVDRLQAKLDKLPEWFRAQEYQIDTVARVGGFFWMDPGALDVMIDGEKRINTDDIHFFDKQSAVFPLPPQRQMPQYQASVIPYLKGADRALLEQVQFEQRLAGYMADFVYYKMPQQLFQAFCAMPDNGNVQYWMGRQFAGQVPDPGVFCGDVRVREFNDMLAADPDNPLTLNGLADALAAAGKYAEALHAVERAVALDPSNPMIQDTYGWILHRLGRNDAALVALEKALARYPDHPVVLFHVGSVRHAMGNTEQARALLERALGIDAHFHGAEQARELLQR